MDMRSEALPSGAKLELVGELDMAAVPSVDVTLRRLEETKPGTLILDLSKLTFIDSSGLRMVLMAAQRAKDEGRRFAIVPGPARVQRIFRITGLDSVLEIVEENAPS